MANFNPILTTVIEKQPIVGKAFNQNVDRVIPETATCVHVQCMYVFIYMYMYMYMYTCTYI